MRSILIPLASGVLLLAACTTHEVQPNAGQSSKPTGQAAPAAAGAPATVNDATTVKEVQEIPSFQDAAAEAGAKINESNADAEFDRLLKEIEADLAATGG